MTYKEARDFIDQSNLYGLVPGLETITELLNRLGNPQDKLKVIHVAGTNGKGSTSAFIATILTVAGYRVGRYISPAIFSYRERIQISKRVEIGKNQPTHNLGNKVSNNHIKNDKKEDTLNTVRDWGNGEDNCSIDIEFITEQGVCDTIATIKPACEAMVLEGFHHPTSFEIETAMTMLYLLWEQVDFTVLEVGLGGRLDATNVIKKPICSVITSISMDHMQYLGDTLEQITREKAGIIKAGAPVVSCEQKPEVLKVLELTCKEQGVPFILADLSDIVQINHSLEAVSFCYQKEDKGIDYKITLLGEHQVSNAVLAIQVAKLLEQLGIHIGETNIKSGLYHTKWSGRFEIVARKPLLIIDGAHNEGAAISLRDSIGLYFTNQKIIYMIGVLSDKDYKSILKHTASLAQVIITFTPNNSRALSSKELAKEARKYCSYVLDAENIENAIQLAYQEANEEDVIIAFGSLSFLGDLVATQRIRKEDGI